MEVVGVDVGFEPLPPFPFDEELEGVEEGLGDWQPGSRRPPSKPQSLKELVGIGVDPNPLFPPDEELEGVGVELGLDWQLGSRRSPSKPQLFGVGVGVGVDDWSLLLRELELELLEDVDVDDSFPHPVRSPKTPQSVELELEELDDDSDDWGLRAPEGAGVGFPLLLELELEVLEGVDAGVLGWHSGSNRCCTILQFFDEVVVVVVSELLAAGGVLDGLGV